MFSAIVYWVLLFTAEVNGCTPKRCKNGGTCLLDENRYKCICI